MKTEALRPWRRTCWYLKHRTFAVRTDDLLPEQTALEKLWDPSDHRNYSQMGSDQVLATLGGRGEEMRED